MAEEIDRTRGQGTTGQTGTRAPYDEMYAPDGPVRPHFAIMARQPAALGPGELDERQRTLARFFLLQAITFTVHGAESSTERIILTDLLPRIIPADEWSPIEAGLVQRPQALNLFVADIYGERMILKDGVAPRELVLGARLELAQLIGRLLEVWMQSQKGARQRLVSLTWRSIRARSCTTSSGNGSSRICGRRPPGGAFLAFQTRAG